MRQPQKPRMKTSRQDTVDRIRAYIKTLSDRAPSAELRQHLDAAARGALADDHISERTLTHIGQLVQAAYQIGFSHGTPQA